MQGSRLAESEARRTTWHIQNKNLRCISRADCPPENAVMIGDRIDNDIEPANKLGMKTIWVKQGFSVYQIPMNDFQQADYVVDRLQNILEVLQ